MKIDGDIQLTKNFKLSEFKCVHCGNVKMPDLGLVNKLQSLRDIINKPISIAIGYRCTDFNKTIPTAAANSLHTFGKAADIHIDVPYDLKLVEAADKAGFSGVGIYDTWLHVDTGMTKRRWDKRTKKDTFKRYEQNNAVIYEIDPLKLDHVWLRGTSVRTAAQLAKDYPNFVNGMFYSGDMLLRLFVRNELLLNGKGQYDIGGRGTLIIYTDGKVEVKTLADINPKGVKLAIQGFNCDFEYNGSKTLLESMRKEGWGENNDHIFKAVCRRHAIGYNPTKNKIIIAIKKTNATGIRHLIRSLGCIVGGNTCAIGMDSGDSHTEVVGSKVVAATTRAQRSIVTFT
jgi:hypothetical protein